MEGRILADNRSFEERVAVGFYNEALALGFAPQEARDRVLAVIKNAREQRGDLEGTVRQ